MAIIKGVTAAKVGQVSPYVEDIDRMAQGIQARDARANEIRDQINQTKAALLKQTRDHNEDFALAQELEKGYKGDVSGLVDQAEMDYSAVNKDQLQTLAADYMGKTEWRVLTEANRNSKEYEKALLDSRGQFGPPVIFGSNPSTESLKDENGNWKNFTGTWEVEKRLDHSQAAKKLYDNIGSYLTEEVTTKFATESNYGSIPNADGTSEPAWVRYWKKRKEGDGTNIPQVDSIIDGAIDSFKQDPAGKQYHRIHLENFKKDNPDATHEEAYAFADKKLQDLITTYGISEYKTTHTEDEVIQPIDKGKGRPGSGKPKTTSGAGDDKKDLIPPGAGRTDYISGTGLRGPGGDQKSVFDMYRSDVADVRLSDVAKATKDETPISGYTNNQMLVNSATLTIAPGAVEDPDSPRAQGELSNIGASFVGSDVEHNPAVIQFNQKNTDEGSYMNARPTNYHTLKVENGVITVRNPKDESKTINYTAQGLADQLDNKLFLRDEMREASKGLDSEIEGNLSWKDSLDNKDTDGNLSLSTYIVDQNTGDIEINPLLDNLKELYEKKLAAAPDEGSKLLYEAKLIGIDQKIDDAKQLKEKRGTQFAAITRQVLLNNEHTEIFKDNMELVGSRHQIPEEIVENLITGKTPDGTDYAEGIEQSKIKAGDQIGLTGLVDNMSIEDKGLYNTLKDENGKDLYTEKDNKTNIKKIKQLWINHKSNLLNGNYPESFLTIKDGPNKGKKRGVDSIWADMIDKDPELKKWASGITVAEASAKGGVTSLLNSVKKGSRNMDASIYEANSFNKWKVNEDGYIILEPAVKNNYENSYRVHLQNTFKSDKGDIVKFVDEIETMNDVYMNQKTTLYKASSANVAGTGYAEGTWEEKGIFQTRRLMEQGANWIRNAKFSTTAEEDFDHQSLADAMHKEYNKLVDAKAVGGKSYSEWEKGQLDNAYQGIRYEPDEEGGVTVAHYEYSLNGKKYFFEHDIDIPRDQQVRNFGVPHIYFTLGKELKDGLKANKRMYADFTGFGQNSNVRLHKATTNIGKGSNAIKRGQYYILTKDPNKSQGDDGNPEWNPNDEGLQKKVFPSYDDFFRWFNDRNGGDMKIVGQLNTYLHNITTGGQDLSYALPANSIYLDKTKYPDTPEGKAKVIEDMKKDIAAITGQAASTKKINASTTIDDLTTAGVVSKNTKTGYHTIKVNDFDAMNVEDQANLGMKFNTKLVDLNWYPDKEGHKYLTDSKKLMTIGNLSNTVGPQSDRQMKATKPIVDFIQNTDKLVGAIVSGNIPANINPNHLNMFQGLTKNDKIYLTSVLRSLQDNTRAYRNRLNKLTESQHMRGNSVDIRTAGNKQGSKVGTALWEFFKTSSGKAFLKANNMNALYHDAGTGYHIDISVGTDRRPAGGVTDKS